MKRWLALPRSVTALTMLLAMVLVLPWPFYLVAVLSIEPLPMAALLALVPFFFVLMAPQIALAVVVFDFIARAIAKRIDSTPFRWPVFAVVLAAIAVVPFLPVYGGGENIAGGMRLHNLSRHLAIARGEPDPAMMESLARGGRYPAARPIPPNATLESLGAPQVRLPAAAAQPMAPAPCERTPGTSGCVYKVDPPTQRP